MVKLLLQVLRGQQADLVRREVVTRARAVIRNVIQFAVLILRVGPIVAVVRVLAGVIGLDCLEGVDVFAVAPFTADGRSQQDRLGT